MKPINGDQLSQAGHPRGQRRQQPSQGVGLHVQFGDAGALARNAEKLNMHKERLSQDGSMAIDVNTR